MIFYVIVMLLVAAFFYRESNRLVAGKSQLLKEMCDDPLSAKKALGLLRRLFLVALVSAVLMAICLLLAKLTGKFYKPLAILSILCYAIGFIAAMLQLKKF